MELLHATVHRSHLKDLWRLKIAIACLLCEIRAYKILFSDVVSHPEMDDDGINQSFRFFKSANDSLNLLIQVRSIEN